MKKGAIGNRGFDAMADGMAEVEKGASSRSLLFVCFDYPALMATLREINSEGTF